MENYDFGHVAVGGNKWQMLRGGEEVITKAVIWKDLAQIRLLLLELEKERPDPRITQAKQLTVKAMKELDRHGATGPQRQI